MNVFFLYRNEADRKQLKPLLDQIKCEHGPQLPRREVHSVKTMVQSGIHDRDEARSQSGKMTIIQWGLRENEKISGQDEAGLSDLEQRDVYEWMNPNEVLIKLRDHKTIERMLTSHGVTLLPSPSERSSTLSLQTTPAYRLFVFNLQPISLYKGIAKLEIDWQQRSQRQLIREAIRAVYVLGLDFAEVELKLHKNKWAIIRINATPFMTEHTTTAWAEAINAIMEEPNLSNNERIKRLQIGSDSEFILRNIEDGKVVMADRFFSKKGTVGYDGLRLSGRTIIFPFVELRPAPVSGSEAAVHAVQTIRRTMLKAASKIGNMPFEWLAGGMPIKGLSLGGHLHFSGIPLKSNVLRVLDNYLALPMLMVETDKDRERRPKFGFVGDFRMKTHGGFEYRTLPSWLVSIRITYAVFAMAHFLMLYGDQLKQRPLSDPRLLEAFYHGEKNVLLPSVQSIWDELKQLPAFMPYAESVQPLIDRSIAMKTWPQERDFRKSWRVMMPELK